MRVFYFKRESAKEILDSFCKPEILNRLPENISSEILKNRNALEQIIYELQDDLILNRYLNRFAISTLITCPFLFKEKMQMSPLGMLAYIASLALSFLVLSERKTKIKKTANLELQKMEILNRIMPLFSKIISNDIGSRELLSEGEGRYEDFPV